MYEVSVSVRFVARHQLRQPDGRLEPLHEHVWRVTAAYRGPKLDERGVLADFTVVQRQLAGVLAALDGQELNRVPGLDGSSPSAENVARYVAERLPAEFGTAAVLQSVEVEEAHGCVARHFPAGN